MAYSVNRETLKEIASIQNQFYKMNYVNVSGLQKVPGFDLADQPIFEGHNFSYHDAISSESNNLTPMQEVSEALKVCGFGWFHIRLMVTAFFGASCAVLVPCSTSYIITSAECDLKMDLVQKGVLNAMTFVGMFSSTVISGYLSDTFGRKVLLVSGFGSLTFFTVVTAMSQTFLWICMSKFLEGAMFAAAFNPVCSFTSECCHDGVRGRLMMYQGSCQAVALVWLALFSWAVFAQDWTVSLFNGAFVLNTWNFFLLISAIVPLMATILYWMMPESPKYLVFQHRYQEAREVLIAIYKENTTKSADTFPYKDMWKNREKEFMSTVELTDKSAWDAFTGQLVTGLRNCKPLFKKPLGPYMALFCGLNFLIMLMYNVFRLWFPQLSTVVEYYSKDPNHNKDLCSMLDAYIYHHTSSNQTVVQSDVCIPNKSGTETYINSVVFGVICIPPFLLTGILVNKFGKKLLLMISGLTTVALTLALRWSVDKYAVVGLISTDVGVGQMMMALMQIITVETFPTSARSLSISLLMTAGRVGTLVGNLIFPILLKQGSSVPFYTLAGNMMCVTALFLLLPKMK